MELIPARKGAAFISVAGDKVVDEGFGSEKSMRQDLNEGKELGHGANLSIRGS